MTNNSARVPLFEQAELPIREIYLRLSSIGFSKEFVAQYVLPDWWDDELSANPATHAIAELALMRKLKLPIEALRDPEAILVPAIDTDYRLKAFNNIGNELLPAIAVAQSVAEALVDTEVELPQFVSPKSADDVRHEILQSHNTVSLETLLGWAWSQGIIVANLRLPDNMRRFAGIALIVDNRPVIMLAANHKQPAWKAFHLAHELAHLLLEHVKAGDLRIDEEVGINLPDSGKSAEIQAEENDANEYALRLLTGHPPSSFGVIKNLTPEKLRMFSQEAERDHHIDAGVYALVSARASNYFAAAQEALRVMGLDDGAREIIDQAAQKFLPREVDNSLLPALHMIGLQLDKSPCLLRDF